MHYDGAVLINTQLDTENLEKDIEEVSGEFGGLKGVLQKTGKAISDALSRPVGRAAAEIKKDIDACAKAIERYRAQIQKAQTAKLPFEEKSRAMGAELDEAQRKLSELQAQKAAIEQAMKLPEGRAQTGNEIEAWLEAQAQMPAIQAEIAKQQASVDSLEKKWNDACDKVDKYNAEIKQSEDLIAANEAKAGELADELKLAKDATEDIKKNSDGISTGMTKAGKSARTFSSRLKGIALGALIFNEISSSLRKMTEYFGNCFKSNKALTSELAKLKGALLTAFQPIYQVVAPALTQLTRLLTAAVLAVAKLFSMLSGTTLEASAETAKKLNDEANALDRVGDSAKKAQKGLAGFDDLNVMQDTSQTGAGGENSNTVEPSFSWNDIFSGIDMTNLKGPLSELKDAFGGLVEVIGNVFSWIWDEILVPLGEWFIDEAAPASVEALSAAFEGLGSTISVILHAIQGCWDVLQPIFRWIGDTVIVILKDLRDIGTGVAKKWKENEPKIKKIFENIGKVIEKVWAVVGPIFTWIRDGLSQIAVDTPINDLQYIIDLLYGLSEILAGIFSLDIGQIFNGFGALVGAELEKAGDSLRTYAQAVGIDTDALDKRIAGWAEDVGQFFSDAWAKVEEVWGDVSSWFSDNVITPVQEAFAPIGEWFSELWGGIEQTFSDIFYNIGVIAEGCWEIIQMAWQEAGKWFDENIIQPVAGFFSDLWSNISYWATEAWDNITETIAYYVDWIDENIIQPISGFFSDLWEGIKQAASDAAEAIRKAFQSIGQFFKDILNGVIYGLNSALSWIFGVINKILTGLKNINIAGATPFEGVRTINVPQIPYLAQGAVLPANKPFMAVVGDQRHGTNVEAPLSTIQEALDLALADRLEGMMAGFNAVTARQEQILSAILGLDVSDGALYGAVERHYRKMTVAAGGV